MWILASQNCKPLHYYFIFSLNSSLYGCSRRVFEILDDGACKNVKGLGTGVCTDPANFSAKKYQGIAGRKAKCKWAKGCGVEWDGITNVQGLC